MSPNATTSDHRFHFRAPNFDRVIIALREGWSKTALRRGNVASERKRLCRMPSRERVVRANDAVSAGWKETTNRAGAAPLFPRAQTSLARWSRDLVKRPGTVATWRKHATVKDMMIGRTEPCSTVLDGEDRRHLSRGTSHGIQSGRPPSKDQETIRGSLLRRTGVDVRSLARQVA
jgi:hypothetical protein